MKNFKEVSIIEITNELESGNKVVAVVLTSENKIIRGGDFIKSGVYELNNKMSIADIARFKREDNVVFYAHKKDEIANNGNITRGIKSEEI